MNVLETGAGRIRLPARWAVLEQALAEIEAEAGLATGTPEAESRVDDRDGQLRGVVR